MQVLPYTISLGRKYIESGENLIPFDLLKNEYLRVDHDEEDSLIKSFILAAIDDAEGRTGREILRSEFIWRISEFKDEISLPITPCDTCVSIVHDDEEIPQEKYKIVAGNMSPLFGKIVSLEGMPEGEYEIKLIGGYQQSNLPPALQKWILTRISDYYEQRESIVSGANFNEFGRTFVNALLDKYTIVDI